jgi:hypothetical protein
MVEFSRMAYSSLPPRDHLRDIAGPLSIEVESLMVIANLIPIATRCKFKHPKKRSTTDELILALDITDNFPVIKPMPFGLTAYIGHMWYGGQHSCHFYLLMTL